MKTDKNTTELMKKCSQCGKLKPLTEYHVQSEADDGHKNICKSCVSDSQGTRYYWKKSDGESYRKHVFNRKKYFETEYPKLKYSSFTSFLFRKVGSGIGGMTKKQIDKFVWIWTDNAIERGLSK